MGIFTNTWQRLFGASSATLDPNDDRYYEPGLAFPRLMAAGVHVNQETALKLAAVIACIRVISNTVARLPWQVRQRQGENRIDRSEHIARELLGKNPNPEITPFAFRQTMLAQALLRGNAVAEIVRDGRGKPAGLYPIEGWRVRPRRTNSGGIEYLVNLGGGETTTLDSSDVFHLAGLTIGDGTMGLSPIEYAAESIGVGLAAQRFGAAFFGNGAHPSGAIRHPGKLATEAKKQMASDWNEWNQGPAKAQKTVVLDEGMEYQPFTIPPEQAQFIATREFEVEEICRWFGVPPHKIFDLKRSTNNNIEQQAREFVDDAVAPWAARLEQEADRKLFTRDERMQGYYSKIDLKGLLRGDSQARGEYYTKLWNIGVLSTNEIRSLEDLDPVDGGDRRFVQLNMTTLDRAVEDGGTGNANTRNGGQDAQRIILGNGELRLNGVHH